MRRCSTGRLFLVIYLLLLELSCCFRPEIHAPYRKVLGSSTVEISRIGETLTCDEQMNSLEDCAIQCYKRKFTNGCPGFYVNVTESGICYVCRISKQSEVLGNMSTTFNSNDIIYLFKTEEIVPDLTLDFDNYTGNTFYGDNIIGTASGIVESDHVSGIKGKALYLHDGAGVLLPGSGTECWTNIDNCTPGITVSIWYKQKVLLPRLVRIVDTGFMSRFGFSIALSAAQNPAFRVYTTRHNRHQNSPVPLVPDVWYQITAVYDLDRSYMVINGVEIDIENYINADAGTVGDFNAHIGVQHSPPYTTASVNGYVDQFKFYSRVLNSAGMSCSLVLVHTIGSTIKMPQIHVAQNGYRTHWLRLHLRTSTVSVIPS